MLGILPDWAIIARTISQILLKGTVMYKAIRFIVFYSLLIGTCFCETQTVDILIEGDIKNCNSYWTINPITFKPLKILSKVGLKVEKVQPLKRTPVENDDYVEGKVTYVGKGYRLDPIDLESSNLATKLLVQDILANKGTQKFEWGAAPDADKYVYKACDLLTGFKHPAKFRGVLKVETYLIDGETKIYSKLNVIEIKQDADHYRNLFLRELFSDSAEKRTKFEELHDTKMDK